LLAGSRVGVKCNKGIEKEFCTSYVDEFAEMIFAVFLNFCFGFVYRQLLCFRCFAEGKL
jgi:hypothetical protein